LEDTSQDTATFSSPAGSAAAPAADPWEWEYRYAQVRQRGATQAHALHTNMPLAEALC
jgi:hypothetical protein